MSELIDMSGHTDLWSAPHVSGPITALCEVPGSKSMTNRALILAALADGPSRISGGLRARDTNLMVAALASLGTVITDEGDDWIVEPRPLHGPAHIDCGLAGTVMRFVPPAAALATGDIRFDGDPRARVRPMRGVIHALKSLGIRIDDDARGTLPFTMQSTGSVNGGEVLIDASASSQFVSALLLAAPRFGNGLIIRHEGPAVPSLPHIDMTVAMLREHGVTITEDVSDPTRATWTVAPSAISACDRVIEPDLSNAAPFLAAAAVCGGTVTIPRWPTRSTQAGAWLPQLFEQMGCRTELTAAGLTLHSTGELSGLVADLHDVGELVPVLAAVAALASTPSHITGIAHLRGHETDRLAALAAEINKLGGSVVEHEDGLEITPAPLRAGVFLSYEDHRMATAGAVIGLKVPNVRVENIATTGKTLPDFDHMWHSMLKAHA